jgi:hypothetical protein
VLRIAGRARTEVERLALLYTFFPEEYVIRETTGKEWERRFVRWRRARAGAERPQLLLDDFVARLEAPVTYPPQDGPLHGLHAGARHAPLTNPAPSVLPDINVSIDALATQGTGVEGVLRQSVFDYAPTPDDHRMVQVSIRPQARLPRLRAPTTTSTWRPSCSSTAPAATGPARWRPSRC